MEQGELESSPYSRRYSRSPEAELSLHDDDSRISGDDRKHSDEDLDHHDTDHDHRRPDSEDERRSDGRRNSHSGDEVEILDSPADRFRILFFILDLFNFLKHCYFASMDCMWGGGGLFQSKKGDYVLPFTVRLSVWQHFTINSYTIDTRITKPI